MSNTFTSLIPAAYAALDTISREMVGFIPAVRADFDAERVAVGQSIVFPVVAGGTPTAITPAITPPALPDSSAPGPTITVSKAYARRFHITGEENKGLVPIAKRAFMQNSIEQVMRELVNLIEYDLFITAKQNASRAYGSAGVTPFATAADMSDLSGVALILDDNGCPKTDRHIVLNNTSIANLRGKQANLFNSGPDLLRLGMMTMLEGFGVHQSGQIITHTKGTASGYKVDLTAGYAAGSKTIHVDTGTGTMVAGDILTNAATGVDTHKYVVKTGHGGDADQDVVIQNPGLKVLWSNNNDVSIGANYLGNFAFHRDALWLATRLPAEPEGGDVATDASVLTDPVSGLSFDFREYKGYHANEYELGIAWGYAAIKPEHIAILLG